MNARWHAHARALAVFHELAVKRAANLIEGLQANTSTTQQKENPNDQRPNDLFWNFEPIIPSREFDQDFFTAVQNDLMRQWGLDNDS